jgi:hypothetical protein
VISCMTMLLCYQCKFVLRTLHYVSKHTDKYRKSQVPLLLSTVLHSFNEKNVAGTCAFMEKLSIKVVRALSKSFSGIERIIG